MIPRSALYAGCAAIAAAISFAAGAARPSGDSETAALDGAGLFRAKGCATCHDGPDGHSMTDAGPSLAAARSWAGERVEGMSADEYLAQSMRTPSAFISPATRTSGGPGAGQMPLLQLSDDEIDALVDYLLVTDPNDGRE